jgi:hypothetical protein
MNVLAPPHATPHETVKKNGKTQKHTAIYKPWSAETSPRLAGKPLSSHQTLIKFSSKN